MHTQAIDEKEQMNIVIAGHVDHGKSTVIGRLLADTNSLPKGKLQQVQDTCKRNSKPFEYAFLIDALKDEQDQGITIDSARVFFKTQKRNYIIIDAPGHIEFLKNMVTGASRAEAALLVIDAAEGVQENSRRHGYMMSMLGISQIAVLVNKMDLADYSEKVFNDIVKEYTAFLKEINVEARTFIPISAREGDSIAALSNKMPWYKGFSVLGMLDEFTKEEARSDQPFRMPVQGVYKFTNFGDDRRIVAGTIETGSIKAGEEVIFLPSGKKSKIKSIEYFNGDLGTEVSAGMAPGFTLTEQIYVTRGEIMAKSKEKLPHVTTRIKVNLFWLGKNPLVKKKDYLFKVGAIKVTARLEEIIRVIDASNLQTAEKKDFIGRHDVAECVLSLAKPIAFDLADELDKTSRFVLVDDYEIWGGGIIREALTDQQSWVRDFVMLRNFKWEKSKISPMQRSRRYNQKSMLVILTGPHGVGKKDTAKQLEWKLFSEGKEIYYLGIGNVLLGVDADITKEEEHRREHIRRLAEVAYILMDAGLILVITADDLNQADLEIIKTVVDAQRIETIWMGENVNSDIAYDFHIWEENKPEEATSQIEERLMNLGVIFRPW